MGDLNMCDNVDQTMRVEVLRRGSVCPETQPKDGYRQTSELQCFWEMKSKLHGIRAHPLLQIPYPSSMITPRGFDSNCTSVYV